MSPNDTVSRRSFLKAAGGATAAATFADSVSGVGSATAQGNQQGGLLTYARGSDSGTLDPQNTTSGEDVKVTNQVYDTLIQFKPGETSLTKGLATNWNLKGTTTTLKLREGVKFQNGETFTADDVIATYRRFTDSSYQYYPGDSYVSSYGPFTLGNWVKNMKKNGDYNLTIELKQKYAPFLRNLAMFASSILSEKAIQNLGKKLSSNPVGTGPFQFDNWDKSNQRIRLSAYDDYWGDGPNVDQVVFTAIASNTTRAQTLDSGDADIIDGLGAQSAQIVRQSNNASLREKEGINVGYMAFNMANVEAFRDKRVRQAISYAINTKAIVDTIFKGIAEQASQPIPSNVLGYNKNLNPYPYNPDKARSMLNDAGYGDGFSFELATFKNPRAYNPSPIQAAQVVKSNLNDVGIDVTINQQSFNPFLNYTESGKHDACFLGWMTDNADPDNFYYALLDPGIPVNKVPNGQDWVSFDTKNFNTLDVAAWANTDFMKLVRRAQRTYDDNQRAKLYRQAGKLAHDEAPWVFMDHAKELRGVGNNVDGYVVELISGPFLNLVSLQGQ
ncbi:extracellular solute-binding protein family 5 [Haladaptatus paucihalophilus DX253]|uniref:Extracellular solute-binding protein family 5 n=1 Tax=Haladaptatus paucihalophilus DX253 TaxID=797209 RepID=E7QUE3_HALPU|nr:ABC transporter substrate-binding protein [Haladaptatus paucihalophilus]EFW92222.1 extracellular solute-binding protein family 5 [Haladaptatus paucihalophilus DX253]SHK92245.1 peptide/nickel transport system substrate-binding protein [Haladaptatus paucihalophilus DX253]